MRRITVTLPDELADELDAYLACRDIPPTTAAVVRAALREFFRNRHLRERDLQPATKPFALPIMPEKDARGEPDVSVNHDAYLAEREFDRNA